MPFKYENDLCEIDNCPPQKISGFKGTAFRFVFEDLADPRNHNPPAKLNVKRKIATAEDMCSDLALSFFSTRDSAVAFYRQLENAIRNIRKRVGTHIASVSISHDDGLATKPDDSGHFDLFEHDNADFIGRFEIQEAL